jgi:hypothetical protein
MNPRQNLYPILDSSLATPLADQPIQINGMTVEFDQQVSLFPVEVVVQKLKHGYRALQRARGSGRRARS